MTHRYHDAVILNPDTLFTSVGTCGTNQPDEVKKIQHMIANAGYQTATGREIITNGHCDQATIEAIYWYQRLLNMHPTGLITPVDTFFMEGLKNMSSRWRPQHKIGSLYVREGQFTFDAEGRDYITAVEPLRQRRHPYFSRILHHPSFTSGVTIGRGFDMKTRSSSEIHARLKQASREGTRTGTDLG